MHRSHVDSVEGTCLFRQLVYDGLGLPDVAGPAHLGERQGTKSRQSAKAWPLEASREQLHLPGDWTEHLPSAPGPASLALTLMFLPPSITEFICSKASCAASGTSYSTNAKPWTQDVPLGLESPGGGRGGRGDRAEPISPCASW